MKVGIAFAALTLTVSCSTPRPFNQTDIGKKRIELSQSRNLEDLLSNPDRDTSFEGLFGDAAFEMTQGMDVAGATKTFEADGASCDGSACVWKYTVREALFPCGIPPLSLISMCIRQPGPRRTYEKSYQVMLLGKRIQDRTDISTKTTTRNVTINE